MFAKLEFYLENTTLQEEKTCFTPSLASYRFIIKRLECRKCVTHQNYQKEHELYRKQKVAPIFCCIKTV